MSALLKTLFPCLPLALKPDEGRIRLPITTTASSTYHPHLRALPLPLPRP